MGRLFVVILLLALAGAVFVVRRRRGSLLGDSQQAFLIRRLLGLAGLVTVAIGFLYFVVAAFVGSGIFAPHDPQGILKSAHGPSAYIWTGEAVHRFRAAGQTIREDSRRNVDVDLKTNSYQVLLTNVLPDATEFESDGQVAIRNTQARQQAGQPWQQVNNACRKQPPPPATLVAMPDGKSLAAASPRMADSGTTVSGEKAWLLDFKPSPQIIEQMMLVPFLATPAALPQERHWALTDQDKRLIDQGRYTVKNAEVWVTKGSPRTVYQIAVSLTLPDGSSWDLLAAVRELPGQSAHLNLKIPVHGC